MESTSQPVLKAAASQMDDRFWYLKNSDLFNRLSPEQILQLESRCRIRSFERRNLVYLPADASNAVLLLVSGRVKLYHLTSEGKETLLGLIEPGELFGELAVLDSGRRDEFAETMLKSTVILVPRDAVQKLMEEQAVVSLAVTRLMGLRRQRMERRLKSLLFCSNRERLIHLLLELTSKYGQRSADGIQLGIRLSHQELASMIGSTRETVTVTLGDLQLEGSVIVRRRQIILTNVDRLATSIGEPVPLQPDIQPQEPRLLKPT